MPSIKKLVANDYRLNIAHSFINDIEAQRYYVFMGNHANAASIAVPNDDVYDTVIHSYRNMLFGKKVQPDDISLVISRHDYESNTVYDKYDDSNPRLFESMFYTIVQDGSNYHVFKCIDNNDDNPSTVQPSRADAEYSGDIFYPVDGYRWKWMYTSNSSIVDRFATDDLFPVSTDANVAAESINGAIDAIRIDNKGQRYDNYTNGIFSSSDLRLNGNTIVYAINSSASSVNNFYNGCYLYITSGDGIGSYKRVVDYVVNSSVKFVVLDSPFDEPPQINWTYEISPAVVIIGDGTQSVNAVARAIINSYSTNSVYRIEMIERGADYKFASAYIHADPVVSVTINAAVSVIYSPPGGHGSDAPRELGAHSVMLWSKFSNTESNTIMAVNDFSQIGLMKNPKFANVTIDLTTSADSFLNGELIYKIVPKLLPGIVTSNATNTVITFTSANPVNSINTQDWLYVSSSNGKCLRKALTVNSTAVVLDAQPGFDSSNAYAYYVEPLFIGTVINTLSNTIFAKNVENEIVNDDLIIGETSGATGIIDQVKVNNQDKGFTTFVQTYVYSIDNINGTFTEDEVVFQGNVSIANAILHSVEGSGGVGVLRTTNQCIPFADGEYIFGATSDASARIISKYSPDIVFGSGEVLYLENSESAPRSNTTSETFKLVFGF